MRIRSHLSSLFPSFSLLLLRLRFSALYRALARLYIGARGTRERNTRDAKKKENLRLHSLIKIARATCIHACVYVHVSPASTDIYVKIN